MRLRETGGLAELTQLWSSTARNLNPGLTDVLAAFPNNVGTNHDHFGGKYIVGKKVKELELCSLHQKKRKDGFFIVVKQNPLFPCPPTRLWFSQKQDLSLLPAQSCPPQALGELTLMNESAQR